MRSQRELLCILNQNQSPNCFIGKPFFLLWFETFLKSKNICFWYVSYITIFEKKTKGSLIDWHFVIGRSWQRNREGGKRKRLKDWEMIERGKGRLWSWEKARNHLIYFAEFSNFSCDLSSPPCLLFITSTLQFHSFLIIPLPHGTRRICI